MSSVEDRTVSLRKGPTTSLYTTVASNFESFVKSENLSKVALTSSVNLLSFSLIGLAAAIDLYCMSRKSSDGYTPGDLGIDPLGFYPFSPEDRKEMQLKEIKNDRLAMLAIFGFAVQEATSKVGVVDETPFFFKPITQTLGPYMDHLTNSGYINPN
ncbi:hypothetical protein TrVE_jg3671 [Triparma verrucosa]|uniref:Chlorophyll a-b binding protein, chloroplastic n=1 Tax=Triparma verrucosa TaxID=1606542 RepID=A0A9W7KWJ2_9STRA|nr:hypothetical protein TrVE_jg3671 [Triparma verrucosa]